MEKNCNVKKSRTLIKDMENFASADETTSKISEAENEISDSTDELNALKMCNREFKIKLDVSMRTKDDFTAIQMKTEPLEHEESLEDLSYTFDDSVDVKYDENSHPKESVSKARQISEINRKRKATIKEELPVQQQQSHLRLVSMSPHEEQQVLERLEKMQKIVDSIPEARRLRRKLLIRKAKRERNLSVFDFHAEVRRSLVPSFAESEVIFNLESTTDRRLGSNMIRHHEVGYFNIIGHPYRKNPSFYTCLMGDDEDYGESFISPFTSRCLKPVIFQDYEVLPLKLRLLQEIVAFPHRKDSSWKAPPRHPIDYCYVRPQHIPVVNAFCREFFWPGIDLSECLQYPDFSCVALYRRVLVGFAFMVPNVNYNEAYITYIFTHPEWRKVGIATFMLYHLIQTCMGKDVTLHVSTDNPALLLYQKFGFKIEDLFFDFYAKYLSPDSKGCRDALFLRLSK